MANQLTKGLVSALIELERKGLPSGMSRRDVYYQASQYMNVYGGIHILDHYSAEEISEKIVRYMVGKEG